MLIALDHVALIVHDLKSAADRYGALLGCEPTWRGTYDGADHAWFQLDNMALDLIAPGTGNSGKRAQARIDTQGEGLWALAFATVDLAQFQHVLERRGISLVNSVAATTLPGDATDRHDFTTRELAPEATFGTTIFLVERKQNTRPSRHAKLGSLESTVVTSLDHVVVTTSHPERATAIYGARLGLDLKLDRTNPDWNARLMFFKCGDLIVEVAHTLKSPDLSADDKLWGLSWRVSDVVAAHARMKSEGFNLSDIRTGRKPGTSVFTVRDAPASVPTLVIGKT